MNTGYDHGEDEMIEREKQKHPSIIFPVIVALLVALFILKSCDVAHAMDIPSVVSTIIQAESSGQPHAIGDHGQSRGLMQIKFATWRRYSRLPFRTAFDAVQNRKVGEAHVRRIVEHYGRTASPALVILTYNTGHFYKHLPKWILKHPNKIYRRIFIAALRRHKK